MANTQAPSLTSEGKQKLTASRKIVGNLLAALPAIDFGTFVFNKEKEKDPKYKNTLSETQALWSDKYEYYDTKNERIIPKTEYVQGAMDDENVVRRESPLWDKSLDNYTLEQAADKKYLEQNPEAKKVAIAKERAKIYDNPNDDPYLQEAYKRARAQVDELLSLAKSGEHPLSSQITTIYEEDPEELYQETARQYLGEFAQTFPEKALSYSEYAVNNPDNYDLHLLNQVVRSEGQDLSVGEMSNEYMEQESQPHDEVEQDSIPSYGAASDFSTGKGRGSGIPSFSFPGRKEASEPARPEKPEPKEEEEGHNPKENPEEDEDKLGKKKAKKKTSKKGRLMNLMPSNRATDAINNARTAMNIARALGMGSIGWILVIIVVIILYLVIFGGGSTGGGSDGGSDTNDSADKSGSQQGKYPPIPGLSLSLNGPEIRNNGELIPYTLSFSYNESEGKISPSEIVLFDNLPEGTLLESATPPYTQNGNSIEWKLSDIINLSSISITLKPQLDREDFFVTNKISARTTGGNSSFPATKDNCNGAYDLSANPLGTNFGDPNCTLASVSQRESLFTLLQQLDPANADRWYRQIIPCESSYNPNVYLDHSAGAPDPAGAWGLFQMGRGLNGQFDHGDVDWRTQSSNAVNYNKILGTVGVSGDYWWCAR